MKINMTFPSVNSTCYDIKSLDLGINNTVQMVVEELPEGTQLFFNNDQVLEVTSFDAYTGIESKLVGVSEVLFINNSQIIGSIRINVVNDQAASLGLSSEAPILK